MISLVPITPGTLTSYITTSGRTRHSDGSVPHRDQVKTVAAGDLRWRMTPGGVAALAAANAEFMERGGEPVRLTDVWRDPDVQAKLRQGYDWWIEAGSPAPGSLKWRDGMKTAYACQAGESNHGWGGAIDLDVGALVPAKGVARGSYQALSLTWEVLGRHGFTPVISEPNPKQSEAWHQDRLGLLGKVRDLYRANNQKARAGAQAARVGHMLTGTMPKTGRIVSDWNTAMVQARCAIGGAYPGPIDGIYGATTRAALSVLGISAPAKGPDLAGLIASLDANGVGVAEMAAA